MKKPISVYIHWPFCAHKCPYCDFNSHVREAVDHDQWRDCFSKAIDAHQAYLEDKQIQSVFFGGGTPSLMEPQTVETILSALSLHTDMKDSLEITLEANPTSIETEKFSAFRTAGINRVSVGVQALDDKVLKFLGRQHSAKEALNAIEIADKVFERYSFDLMYARPDQTLSQWEEELLGALRYAKGHMSLYQLTIEKGTAFHTQHKRGDFVMPDPDMSADFYELTQNIMDDAGLPAYEVSNHAAEGQESLHNMTYWTYGDYLGIGPGAHGRITHEGTKWATREHSAPEIWLDKVTDNGSAEHPRAELNQSKQFIERLMMGLRLNDGISIEPLNAFLDFEKVDTLKSEGLLSYDQDHISLTRDGLLRLNSVVSYLIH